MGEVGAPRYQIASTPRAGRPLRTGPALAPALYVGITRVRGLSR